VQKIVARWSGHKVKFNVESGSGHSASVDEPPLFGQDEGMRPTEMLLAALGACTGINAVLLLKKFKQPYTSLDVEVEGDQTDEWPHAFTDIRITFAIKWSGPYDEKLVTDALDMACNKYCPVDATITLGAGISHTHRPETA
jgi:putative redox protein